MANIIKIKRSATTATPVSLAEGELAYSENSNNLFIGTNGGVDVTKIGGNTDVLKLAGIATGAQVNTVDSVNGNTGVVNLGIEDLSDVTAMVPTQGDLLSWNNTGGYWENVASSTVGVTDHTLLSNIGTNTHAQIDTHLADGAVHFTQAAISITESQISDLQPYLLTETDPVFLAQKGTANGVATLGADSKIPSSQLPALAITSTYVVADQTAQLALTVQEGDVAVRSDENKSYIALNATNATMADWQVLLTPVDAIQSVNGQTGTVVLTTSDIAEGTNLYYTELRVSANTDVAASVAHAADGSIHYAQSAISITESQISDLGTYETAFAKNTGFNLNLGTTAGTVSEGNHNHDTAYMAIGVTIDGGSF